MSEKTGVIYMLENQINGKKYIGQTIDLNRRIGQHVRLTKQVIDRAIDIYGIENFEILVLEEDISIEKLNKAERFWIKKHNTYKGQDYNLAEGGKRVGSEHRLKGEEHPQTNLTVKKAREILLDRIEDRQSVTELAQKYDISHHPIAEILQGTHWTVRDGNLQDLVDKAPKRSELISEIQKGTIKGAKNPSAKGGPDEARKVLELRIQGLSSGDISEKTVYGTESIMEIIRGEHWTLENNEKLQELASEAPNSFRGRSLNN